MSPGGMCLRGSGFRSCNRVIFWHLLAGTVIRGHAYRILSIGTVEWEEKRTLFDGTRRVWPQAELIARAKLTREYVVRLFGQSDLDNAIQTKAEFSYAIAVMDRTGGLEEGDEQENWVRTIFAASMWIYTKAVVGIITCKTVGSSNQGLLRKLSIGCVTTLLTSTCV